MPATNLILAALVVLVPCVLGRRQIVEVLRNTRVGVVRWFHEAGWAHLVALAAIVGVGVWLRLDFLDTPMRWDESYSFLAYGSQPIGDVTTVYDTVNNHVFSNLLMHFSYSLFGAGFKVIRGPVFLAGVLLPLVAYIASLRIYGRHAALVTAALIAASSELVEYSTNARGYEIASLAAILVLALAPSLLRSRNPTYWGLFSLICALGFYTVPIFVYPFAVLVGGLGLAGLLGQSAHGRGRFFVSLTMATGAALAFTALLYGPILGDMLRATFGIAGSSFAIVGGHDTASNPGLGPAYDRFDIYKELWRLWTLALPGVAKAILVLGFVVAAVSVVRRGKAAFPLAAALVVVVAGLIITNPVLEDPDATRVWLPLLAMTLIAAVGGLLGWQPIREALAGTVANIVLSLGAVAIAVALTLVVSRDDLADQHPGALPSAASIASLVGPRLGGADRLVTTSCGLPIEAYNFFVQGRSPDAVVDYLSPHQAANRRIYVVVNHQCHESLRSVLAQAAPGGGLNADLGEKLRAFPGAAVYEILRSAANYASSARANGWAPLDAVFDARPSPAHDRLGSGSFSVKPSAGAKYAGAISENAPPLKVGKTYSFLVAVQTSAAGRFHVFAGPNDGATTEGSFDVVKAPADRWVWLRSQNLRVKAGGVPFFAIQSDSGPFKGTESISLACPLVFERAKIGMPKDNGKPDCSAAIREARR